MNVESVSPILSVTDMPKSFDWFERWGWRKLWVWGNPPTFGAVGFGDWSIFLCLGGQGGRGKGNNTLTSGPGGDDTSDKGVWISVFVDDVEFLYRQCLIAGLEVTFPPTVMPWKVREMHIRHPDGHVFRIGNGLE